MLCTEAPDRDCPQSSCSSVITQRNPAESPQRLARIGISKGPDLLVSHPLNRSFHPGHSLPAAENFRRLQAVRLFSSVQSGQGSNYEKRHRHQQCFKV